MECDKFDLADKAVQNSRPMVPVLSAMEFHCSIRSAYVFIWHTLP